MALNLLSSSGRGLVLATAIVALGGVLLAQERERSRIPDRYKWNLAEIYPSDTAWRAAKDGLAARLPELRQYQGKLMSSPATLADALDRQSGFDKELSRLYVY